MSFGALIEGDNGQLLIDNTLPVFQVVEEGMLLPNVIDLGNGSSFVYGFQAVFKRIYPRTPLVAIFPPANITCWMSDGNVTPMGFSVMCYDGFPYSNDHGPIIQPSPVYGARFAVISDWIPESDEAFGVRFWADDGRLVYDSGYPLAYFRGFGTRMDHWFNFQTRNDNKLESYKFVHRIPMPDANCGVILNTLPFSGDTYPTHSAGLREPNTADFGWHGADRSNFGVAVQGPPGFTSGSQSVGDVSMYIQSVLFVST